MARLRSRFVCRDCRAELVAHAGRCPRCGAWNSVDEVRTDAAPAARPAEVVALAGPDCEPPGRLHTGIDEFERVLGGGLVPGSVVVIGGEPGIGKSTLMLQAAAGVAATGSRVAYVCGEESPHQVRMRALRLGLAGSDVSLIAETNLEAALAAAQFVGADVVVIDSVQTVYIEGLDARMGGATHLAEVGARLVTWAKARSVATLVTGHVTKTGEIAGPRLLEHLVDVVLYFESAEGGSLRVLRSQKNRFGATDEVGVFEMTAEGLASVPNPAQLFLSGTVEGPASGVATTVVFEGSRPLAIEVEALTVPTALAVPRRVASGLDVSRLHVLLAVLSRRAGIHAGALDVVVSVAGGLRLRDPATDLAVLAALASAVLDQPLPRGLAFVGEVTLSGAVRPVPQLSRRAAELARLGYGRCVAALPAGSEPGPGTLPVRSVREALQLALPGHG